MGASLGAGVHLGFLATPASTVAASGMRINIYIGCDKPSVDV